MANLLIAFSLLVAVQAQTTVQITYEPTKGHFVCNSANKVCTVSGCSNEGDCSIIHNGFTVTDGDNGDLIFTSDDDVDSVARSLSINGNVASSIDCDSTCDCQALTAGDHWCHVPVSTRNDPFAGTGGGVVLRTNNTLLLAAWLNLKVPM